MLRIGLSGGSGSGKGYISSLLRSMGFACLDTDLVVHKLYTEDIQLIEKLKQEFGQQIIHPTGSIDRSVLRNIVFSDKSKLNTLNYIVHKHVDLYCVDWLKQQEAAGYAAAFIDAPQLFEAGMEHRFDYIISVIAPVEERIERIVKRDGITKEAARKRIANQMTDSQYKEKSDFVIFNRNEDDSLLNIMNILDSIGLADKTTK